MAELDNPTNFRVKEKFSENNLYRTLDSFIEEEAWCDLRKKTFRM